MPAIHDIAPGADMPDQAADPAADQAADQAHFRRTLIRVMTVQVVALIVLWLLQSRYAL